MTKIRQPPPETPGSPFRISFPQPYYNSGPSPQRPLRAQGASAAEPGPVEGRA